LRIQASPASVIAPEISRTLMNDIGSIAEASMA
jgi:hypothetical protein